MGLRLIASLLLCIGSVSGVSARHSCTPSCGNIQIRYPFRLKGDNPACGDKRYELTCHTNRTILDFSSGKYYVESISYSKGNENIQIVDVGLARGGCSLPSNTLSPDTILHDERFRHSGPFHTIFHDWRYEFDEVGFLNCTREIEGYGSKDWYFPSLKYNPVPCLSGSDAFVYVLRTYHLAVGNLAPSCRFLAMTTTNRWMEDQPRVFEQLKTGVSLNWFNPNCGPVSLVVQDCFMNTGGYNGPDYQFPCFNWALCIYMNLPLYVCQLNGFWRCLDLSHACLFNYVVFLLIKGFVVLINALWFLAHARILVRLVLPILAGFAFLVHKYREMRVPADAVEKFLINQQSLTPRRYAYMDIIVMTRNFKDKIGQGGFGSVYKGKLPGGFQVAIKILGNSKCNGDDFISEVSTIGTIHHINIVRLVGFCSEGSKRALVYEYLPKGSLDKYIFSSEPANQRPFTFDKLIDIALGVARGIDYLHQGCDMRILHFDIKPQNILLDNCFSPKVSDFGLAKLFPKDHSLVALSAARGTIGYIAPELVSRSFGIISYKSDVYSFGMLLMEMAGGRRNVEPKAENTSQIYYPSWIYDQLDDQSDMHGIVRDVAAIGEIERKLSIEWLWCIQTRPSQRPTMSRVIEMLQAEVGTLQMPPKPFLSAERVCSLSIRDPSMEASSSTLTVISEHESLI